MPRSTDVPLVLAGMVLLAVSSVVWLPAIGPTPIADEAAAREVVLGTLLAHSGESRGEPWVVFENGRQIVLDRIVSDRSPRPAVPAFPRLRLQGGWRAIDRSDQPVDAGFVGTAEGSLLFGKIADERIKRLSIEGAGGGVEVTVGPPGFVVPAPAPDSDGSLRLRWLDAGGGVVRETQAYLAE